jgi:heterodisulfide reductase subunit A-like polyferredoxin
MHPDGAGDPDESGRPRPVPIPGSEFRIEADTVIPAISQSPDLSFLNGLDGLKTSRWGGIEADPVTLETNIKGIFTGGDVVTGPQTYIDAMAAGRKAAISIDRYLKGEDLRVNREGERPQEEYIQIDVDGVEYRARAPMMALPPEWRGSFDETNLGLREKDVIREAERCLQCGGCSECLECVKVCEAKAIDHRMNDEDTEIEVGSIILSPGFDEFEPSLKSEYGYGRFPNVVSSIEFERFLSASGPFKGQVLRPSDKGHPKRIAWIQCVGSRDSHIGKGYCSSVCCMYATKEAVIAKEHAPDVEATIFYMDMRAYGKDFDKYIERAKKDYGVRYIRSRVSHVKEDPETKSHHPLRPKKGNGFRGLTSSSSRLVSNPSKPSEVAETFGIDLNAYGFAKTSVFEPLQTSRPGIFVSGAFSGRMSLRPLPGEPLLRNLFVLSLREDAGHRKEYVPEKNVNYEGPRVGVFVCHCGINIGVVNVPSSRIRRSCLASSMWG